MAAEAVVAVAAEVVEVAAPEEPSVMVSELPLLVVSVVVLPEVPVLEVLPEEWFLSQVSGGQLAVVVPVEVVVAAEVPVGEARGVVLATTLITDLVVITDITVGIGRTGAILTGTHGITGGTIPLTTTTPPTISILMTPATTMLLMITRPVSTLAPTRKSAKRSWKGRWMSAMHLIRSFPFKLSSPNGEETR